MSLILLATTTFIHFIIALPKAIRDNLLDIGICLQKSKSYKDDDAVVSAILLESAIGKFSY